MRQSGHAGNGDNLVLLRNVAVNLGVFADDSFTRPVVERYVRTRHADQPYPPFKKGECILPDPQP